MKRRSGKNNTSRVLVRFKKDSDKTTHTSTELSFAHTSVVQLSKVNTHFTVQRCAPTLVQRPSVTLVPESAFDFLAAREKQHNTPSSGPGCFPKATLRSFSLQVKPFSRRPSSDVQLPSRPVCRPVFRVSTNKHSFPTRKTSNCAI